jgi:hypothetical protein
VTRLLLTVGRKRCPYRCSYCFTDFSQYQTPLTLDEVMDRRVLMNGVHLLYPACDVDLFAMRRWPRYLSDAVELGVSISISTKAALHAADVEQLQEFSQRLARSGHVLKVGVSVTTRSRARDLEPRAPTYEARLETLRQLRVGGVATALVLRPLLADVAPDEYASIVQEAAAYTDCVLTGPEYLDDLADHPRRVITAPHDPPLARVVGWAAGSPSWLGREAVAQETRVRETAGTYGLRVFESDGALMDHLISRASGAERAGFAAA